MKIHKYRDFGEGVLIVYQSKEYVKNNSEEDLIIGLAPFIISKENGIIYHEDSCLTSSELIKLFKKRNNCST